MGKKIKLPARNPQKFHRPGPDNIEVTLTLEKLNGFPFFYTAMMEGTVGAGKKKRDLMIGVAMNGGGLYFRVGDAWYALPSQHLAKVAIAAIHEQAVG